MQTSPGTSLWCSGHRGAMGYEPENTLRSMRRALELGVDWIEIDVHLCEGTPVVIHDFALHRTTSGVGEVARVSLAYLRSLDAGQGERVPLLSEVLEVVGRRAGLNIELKGRSSVGPVVEVVRGAIRSGTVDPAGIILSSFDHPQLAEARACAPELRRAPIVCGVPLNLAEAAEDLGAFSVHVDREFVQESFVRDAHSRGVKVLVWTVNDSAEAARLRALGVDGVISDVPDRVRL